MADRLPSLRGIEAFACVSEVLNLRVASERLNVTVSAVSHRIQGLESELGLRLFDRGPQGLKLTAEGKAFRARLLPGLQALQEATRTAASVAQKRVLRISAPPILHENWLLPRLADFTEAWPDTQVELLTHGRKRAVGSDVVIAPLTSATIRDGATALFSYRATPMCSPRFAERHPVRSPANLLDLPLVDVAPTLPSWSYWFAAAGLGGDVPAPSVLVDNQLLLASALANGLGVGLGARVLFADRIKRGDLVCPFDLDVALPPTVGVLARNTEKETRALYDWIRAEAQSAFGVIEGAA